LKLATQCTEFLESLTLTLASLEITAVYGTWRLVRGCWSHHSTAGSYLEPHEFDSHLRTISVL